MPKVREKESCVSRAGRDVQNFGFRGQGNVFQRRPDIIDVFEDVAFGVMPALSPELFGRSTLDLVEIAHEPHITGTFYSCRLAPIPV